MRNSFILSMILTSIFLSSCKKNYTCSCSNPGGTVNVFTVKDTQKNAKKKCDDYYSLNFGNVSLSETSCTIK